MVRAAACGCLLACGYPIQAEAPKPVPPKPELRLPFKDLGHPGLSTAFLNAGATVLTVNFVDATHLLVTFNTRGLIPRLAGSLPEDQDEIVAAELIAIPSGKIVAATRWHLHDHGRYLWNLGSGRFLFRIRDSLSTFAPMQGLAEGHPFERVAFSHRRGAVVGVDVSPDNRLLTIETEMPRPRATAKVAPAGAGSPVAAAAAAAPSNPATIPIIVLGDQPAKPDVRIDLYRISGAGSFQEPVVATRSASLRSDGIVPLSVDADGYLDAEEKPRNHWSVSFYEFSGQKRALAALDSGCPPDLRMVSRSQYVSLACRGSQGGKTLIAFDLEKHYIWEEPLGSLAGSPFFAYAPSAGRFAVTRRTETVTGTTDLGAAIPASNEDFRVYQTQTGDLLLKLDCDPMFLTPENFDLSSDGMRAAVVRRGAIEVYRLPELTALDRQDLVDLRKVTPPESNTARIDLTRLLIEEEREARESAAAAPVATSGASSAAPVASPSAATAVVETKAATFPVAPPPPKIIVSGDVDSDAPRKPPTLLQPGEKAENKQKSQKSDRDKVESPNQPQ